MLILRRRTARGFNLVEVMVAVSILALLLAVGVPSAAEWIRNTQVRGLAESLQNGLQRARNEAIRRNRPVSFWLVTPAVGVPGSSCELSSASGSWVVSLDNPAGKCDVAASDTTAPRIVEVYANTAGSITVAANDAIDGSGSAASSVTFNGLGVPTGTPIRSIDVSHQASGARRLRIQITTAGSVRMCDRDVAAGDTRACL